MANLANELEECFGSVDLYAILKISKEASQSEIRKAYYRLSIQTHPDKVSPDQTANATKKFQTLCKLYNILSEPSGRALYDETGSLPSEDGEVDLNKDWMAYWRLVFPTVSEQAIDDFEKEYKGSEEEENDLVKVYKEAEGDMDVITSCMLCCSVLLDEQRYREMLEGMIKEGVIEDFAAFSQEAAKKKKARVAKAEKEKKEAEKMEKAMKKKKEEEGKKVEGGENVDDSLSAILLKNKQKRGEASGKFFEELEQKYVGKGGKKGGRAAKEKNGEVLEVEDGDKEDEEVISKRGKRGGRVGKEKNGEVAKEEIEDIAKGENGDVLKGDGVVGKGGKRGVKGTAKGTDENKEEEEKEVRGRRRVNGAQEKVSKNATEDKKEDKKEEKKTEVKGKVEKEKKNVKEDTKTENKEEKATKGKKNSKATKTKEDKETDKEEASGVDEEMAVDGEKDGKKRKVVKEVSNEDGVKKARTGGKRGAGRVADIHAVGSRTRSKA